MQQTEYTDQRKTIVVLLFTISALFDFLPPAMLRNRSWPSHLTLHGFSIEALSIEESDKRRQFNLRARWRPLLPCQQCLSQLVCGADGLP